MRRRTLTAHVSQPETWRLVKSYDSWDEADAQRLVTIRENPSIDARLRPQHGRFVLEIKRPMR